MLNETGIPEIKTAVNFLHQMSADEEMREAARMREKTIRDEISAINSARREGKEEGREEERSKMIAKLLDKGIITEDQIRGLFD